MLTLEKRIEIKELLKSVNVTAMCEELNIDRTGIWRTINGKGRKYSDLMKLVSAIKEQQQSLASL